MLPPPPPPPAPRGDDDLEPPSNFHKNRLPGKRPHSEGQSRLGWQFCKLNQLEFRSDLLLLCSSKVNI